jgi:hypothetical protein
MAKQQLLAVLYIVARREPLLGYGTENNLSA